MKTLLYIMALAGLVSGCASTESVAKMEGNGVKRIFPVAYEKVWASAVRACKHGELSIDKIEPARGYIGAKTSASMSSWGERVAVWVRKVDSDQTEVEVVSQHKGPHLLWDYQYADPILNDIAVDYDLPLQPKAAYQKIEAAKAKR